MQDMEIPRNTAIIKQTLDDCHQRTRRIADSLAASLGERQEAGAIRARIYSVPPRTLRDVRAEVDRKAP